MVIVSEEYLIRCTRTLLKMQWKPVRYVITVKCFLRKQHVCFGNRHKTIKHLDNGLGYTHWQEKKVWEKVDELRWVHNLCCGVEYMLPFLLLPSIFKLLMFTKQLDHHLVQDVRSRMIFFAVHPTPRECTCTPFGLFGPRTPFPCYVLFSFCNTFLRRIIRWASTMHGLSRIQLEKS